MEQCSRMDEIINKISMFLNEVDKSTMKMVIYKKETIRLERYLKMMDIPVDITKKEEKENGSVKVTIERLDYLTLHEIQIDV